MGAKKRSHLVVQHIERMSRTLLKEYPEVIREYVKGKRGVYALYRGRELYYVGLASNLRNRLRAHLRDRHSDGWDSFSLYLTETQDHLRELEALVIRISSPSGNRSQTKFNRSQDLKAYVRARIRQAQQAEMVDLFGPRKARRSLSSRAGAGGHPPLAGYLRSGTQIRYVYKGQTHLATVQADGSIRYRGIIYNSPSLAAKAVTRRPTNGWEHWKYEARPGEWKLIDELRKRRR